MKVESANFSNDVSKILGGEQPEKSILTETKPLETNNFFPPFGSETKTIFNRDGFVKIGLNNNFAANNASFNFQGIQGVKGNNFVSSQFLSGVESLATRLGTKPEYLLSVMSFESGGSFDPAKTNGIGATGLIQFLPSTAIGLGTTTDALSRMSPTEQLRYVEKYFDQPSFKGKLGTLEGLYTAVLSGQARTDPDDVLFTSPSKAYQQNPLDWNGDGKITAGEAVTPVAARMFGGVRNVQQRLLDLGFVPANQRNNFADGQWGKNTSAALAGFQSSQKLNANGLLNDATGRALFGLAAPTGSKPPVVIKPPVNTSSAQLQIGSRGKAVENLQDKLIALGFMTKEQKATGAGIFGPRTEKALKDFQRSAHLEVTGKLSPATDRAMQEIKLSLGNNTAVKNSNVTKGVQDRLVALGYLTRGQVNTGYGTFGPRTEAAIKRFQANNGIQQTGRVGEMTFRTLFSANAKSAVSTPTSNNSGGGNFSVATGGTHYTVNSGILMTDALRPRAEELANRYFQETGRNLHLTSGYRPPARQASAMYDLIINNGTRHIHDLYANKAAADEIIGAYRNNSGSREAAVNAMTRTIENQVNDGVYISSHLRSRAMDVSTDTNEDALRRTVSQMGGTVINEGDHLHVQF